MFCDEAWSYKDNVRGLSGHGEDWIGVQRRAAIFVGVAIVIGFVVVHVSWFLVGRSNLRTCI